MNNKLEGIGKEAVVALFKVLIGHFPGGNDGNQKIWVRIVCVTAGFRTGNLRNMS
jgi:hypothetical protein